MEQENYMKNKEQLFQPTAETRGFQDKRVIGALQ